jgi:uncharacterized protein (DUF952 family)
VTSTPPPTAPLLHLTTAAAWQMARESGTYAADSLPAEGFIHCSEPQQVIWVANTRFRGRTDLVLLWIDRSHVVADVRYENLEGGRELFPHVYGPLPAAAVLAVTPFLHAADGSFGQHLIEPPLLDRATDLP